MDPARMFKESLTSRPELENSQGHQRQCADRAEHLQDRTSARYEYTPFCNGPDDVKPPE
jgi:hypothetical protein